MADISRPDAYHGSLFIDLDLGCISRSGKHLSKIFRHTPKKLLYDSSGQVLSRTSLKSAWSRLVLNKLMLLAENNLFLETLVLCWAALVEIMWKMPKWSATSVIIMPEWLRWCNIVSINMVDQSGWRSGYPSWFNYYWKVSIAEYTIQISLCFRGGFKF